MAISRRSKPYPDEYKARNLFDYSILENIRTNLIERKTRYQAKWSQAATYTDLHRWRPNANNTNSGERKDHRIYRNTAGRALRTFQSGMMNGNTPRSRPWFQLSALGPTVKHSIRKKLSHATEVIDRFFHISNLYQIFPGMYKDLGIFSNAAFMMLPDSRYGFYFYPISMGQYCISTGQDGKVSTFLREYSLSVRQLVERFGLLNEQGQIDWGNSLNNWIKVLWDTQQYEERIVVTQLITPNPMPKENPVDPMDRPFHTYSWISYQNGSNAGIMNQYWPNARNSAQAGMPEKGGKYDPESFIIQVSGYEYFPVIAARWESIPDEAYGVAGPMELAMADVLTLQEEQEYRLEGIAKLVRPPFIGPANLAKYRVSSAAGGITYYDEPELNSLRPLFGVDPKMTELIRSVEETDNFINEAFFVDLFKTMLQESPKSHVSVVEVQKRASESLQLIGPVLGQLDEDVNEPIISNAIHLLTQLGVLEPFHLEDTGPVVPEYISVLAQATKVSQATTIERFVNFTASTAEALGDRALLKLPSGEAMIRRYGQVLGVDPLTVLGEQEFAEERQVMMQAEAEQAQQNDQMDQAAMAKDLSQAKLAGGEESMLDREVEGGEA